jgi:hypothetical protein
MRSGASGRSAASAQQRLIEIRLYASNAAQDAESLSRARFASVLQTASNFIDRELCSYASIFAIAGTANGAYSSLLTLRSEQRSSAANCSRSDA